MQNKETFKYQPSNKQMNSASDGSEQLCYPSMVASTGMMLQLADGTIVACNAAAESIVGLTIEQMQGWTSIEPRWQVIHEDGSPCPGEDHASMVALRTGKPCLNVVMGLYKPSGELIWLLINSQPLFRVEETTPYAVVTTFSDITKQKKLELQNNLSNQSFPIPTQGKQQRTILIVDDSPEDQEMYRRYLLQDSDYNYNILVAESGAEALKLCQRHNIDAILLDFLLPDLDGLEFLELFINKRNLNHPPVIMLTGQGNEAIAVQAMKAGAFDYLVKGRLNSEDLRGAVNCVIAKSQLQARLQQSEEHLRQSQQFIQQIANTVPGLLYVYDVIKQQNIYLNAHAFEFLGYTSKQIQEMGADFISQVMHPDDLARLPLHFAQLQSAPHHLILGIEYRMRHINGEWRWFYSRDKVFKCTPEGAVSQILGIAQDITERKQWENERESILAREQTSRTAAETANRIKDEFLAVLSHELRSPLNPILGWSRLLQTRKLGAAKTAEALATIERNAKLQAELIEDLLDVSRILRGKISLNIAAVNLSSTVLSALDTVRLVVEAKSIQLQTVLPSHIGQVIGDQARLQQIVWNLVSNAVKFTPAGGRVIVRVEQVDTYAQLQVIDTGKGISPDFLPYVFDYFRQADSATTRKFGGLGLGLAIVRHLVELHGGTIFAESPGEGQGATFTVRLPLLKAREVGEVEEVEDADSCLISEVSLSGLRVLVVDDEVDSREFIAFTLEQYGAEVMAVPSAFAALQALAQVKPDVLVSDIGMPEMDGYMLMRQIRAESSQQGKQIPAIALTAYAGEFDQQQALSAGFQMHVSKPVEPVKLVAAVATLTGRE